MHGRRGSCVRQFGTSVGSRALTVPAAIVLAALFEFAGSVLMGAHVAATFKGGIIDMDAVRCRALLNS